jgi:hypothetical protein
MTDSEYEILDYPDPLDPVDNVVDATIDYIYPRVADWDVDLSWKYILFIVASLFTCISLAFYFKTRPVRDLTPTPTIPTMIPAIPTPIPITVNHETQSIQDTKSLCICIPQPTHLIHNLNHLLIKIDGQIKHSALSKEVLNTC